MKDISERASRPKAVLLLAALVLTVALAPLVGGCGAQKEMIPSALNPQAVDVKAEPGPAALPPRSTGVPADSLLEMVQWIARSDGRELHSQRWWDFEKNRFRWDTFGDPAAISGGPTTTASDLATATILYAAVSADGQVVSYDAFSGELRSSPTVSQGEAGGTEREWGSDDVVRLGRQILDGNEVDVYRVDLNIPRGQERSADFGLIFVDSETGLRQREEWLIGSPGDAWVYHLYQYRLVPRTPELEARLSAQALLDMAAEKVAEKLREVVALDFPVWGLPQGAHELVLSGVTILAGEQGTQVSLAYLPEGEIGPAVVTIETNDIRERSDFPEEMLKPREEAVAYSGDTDHIDFRMSAESDGNAGGYDTAVRILLGAQSADLPEPLALGILAMELVDVRSTSP
jgi:hypothetical protein